MGKSSKWRRALAGLLTASVIIGMLQGLPISAAEKAVTMTLLCENQVNPVGIDVLSPQFTWRVDDTDRGGRQTAYRIILSDQFGAIEQDIGSVWDSGRVESSTNTNITYDGPALASSTKYYWKVQVWGADGKDYGFSEVSTFTTGFFSDEDWGESEWIGADDPAAWKSYWSNRKNQLDNLKADDHPDKGEGMPYMKHQYYQDHSVWEQYEDAEAVAETKPAPQLRKDFAVEKTIAGATLSISGLGYYEAYINDRKVGDRVLEPGVTNYDKTVYYSVYDVKELLKDKSENAIGIWLGRGWYNELTSATWGFRDSSWVDQPKARAVLRITYSDGTTQDIVTDETWKTKDSPIIWDCVRAGEIYDARLENDGWANAGYSDKGWQPAHLVDAPKGTLRSYQMEPIRVTRTIKPVSMRRYIDSNKGFDGYLFDFGEEFAGWFEITATGSAGTKITATVAEGLWQFGGDESEFNEQWGAGRYQQQIYVMKGKGTETYHPRFSYFGGRYVLVEGYPGTPTLDSITGMVVHSDLDKISDFTSSNQLINQIQQNTERTMESLVHSYPEDCPHREKLGWTDHNTLMAEALINNYSSQRLYDKWIQDFADCQGGNGSIPYIVPTNGWGAGAEITWAGAYIIIPWYMYLYHNDTRLIEKFYDDFKRYYQWSEQQFTVGDKPFIQRGSNGDWVSYLYAGSPEGTQMVCTAYYYWLSTIMADMAKLLDNSSDAAYFTDRAQKVKQAANTYLYDRETNAYHAEKIIEEVRQANYTFPLLLDWVAEGNRDAIMNKLLYSITIDQNNHMNTGTLGTKNLMDLLPQSGHSDVAYALLTQTTAPSWGDPIVRGATTIPEQWHGGSLIHSCYASVGTYTIKYLGGIQADPENPGFEHIIIKPEMEGEELSWVNAGMDTIKGRVDVSWDRQENATRLAATIPWNATATVYLPKNDLINPTVTVDGKTVWDGSFRSGVDGVLAAEEDAEHIQFTVTSGSYTFLAGAAQTKLSGLQLEMKPDAFASSAAVDLSGSSNDGEVMDAAGKPYIAVTPQQSLKPQVQFTLMADVTTVQTSGKQNLYTYGDDADPILSLGVEDGKIVYRLKAGDGLQTLSYRPVDFTDGKTHHLIALSTGREMQLFYDGDMVESQALAGPVDGRDDAAVTIGGDGSGSRQFDGRIALLRYFDRALEADDIYLQAFDRLPPMKAENLKYTASLSASSSIGNGPWATEFVRDDVYQSTGASMGYSSDSNFRNPHTEWLLYEFPSTTYASEVVLYPRTDIMGCAFPEDVSVEVSTDGRQWTKVAEKTGIARPTTADGISLAFAQQRTKYLRINATKKLPVPEDGNGYRVQFAEIDIFGATNHVQESTLSSGASAPSNLGALQDGIRKPDGEDGSYRADTHPSAEATEWIQADFGGLKQVGEIYLSPAKDGEQYGAGFPVDFTLSLQLADNSWKTVSTQTDYPNPASGKMQIFTFDPVEAKALKLTATRLGEGKDGGCTLSLAELEAYPPQSDVASNAMSAEVDAAALTDGGDGAELSLGDVKLTLPADMFTHEQLAGAGRITFTLEDIATAAYPDIEQNQILAKPVFRLLASVDGKQLHWNNEQVKAAVPLTLMVNEMREPDRLTVFATDGTKIGDAVASAVYEDGVMTFAASTDGGYGIAWQQEKAPADDPIVSIEEVTATAMVGQPAAINLPGRLTATCASGAKRTVMVDWALVKPQKPGQVTVTGYVADTAIRAKATVVFEKVDITAVSLTHSSLQLEVGEEAALTFQVTPAQAPVLSVEWSVSDPAVVQCTNSGNTATISALAEGSATVTVKVNGLSASCKVTVRPKTESQEKNGWQLENGKLYLYREGRMLTGWQLDRGKWYYLDPKSGVMQTGWQYVGSKWYYMNDVGIMQTGWYKVGSKWYFSESSGAMATGWKKLGKWYYFGSDGAMRSGWYKVGAKWYFSESSGAMATGWKKLGEWYYLGSDGAMKTGWIKDRGKWYFMDGSGKMLSSVSRKLGRTTYQFNASGVCLNP